MVLAAIEFKMNKPARGFCRYCCWDSRFFITTPAGTVASSVPPDTNVAAQENTEDSDEDKFKINIEYLFFFEEEKTTKHTTNSQFANKRKVAPNSEEKYKVLPSDWGKLSLMWSANNPSLSQLKLAAIEEISVMPQSLEWGGPSESHELTISLIEKDTSAAAQVEWFFHDIIILLKRKLQGGIKSLEPEPTTGTSNSSAIVNNIQSLRAENMVFDLGLADSRIES
ncbi:hypothetical protein VP01_2501g4 [Puccinia sorghi]|uniref:Uncharacterized protein n=1 Tax=Puccinia sorghi TaxID=27349 RepID=A0A0L6V5S8_9BASI|nr:hypothetical protein VP01_2501g4 [Puccinia sorghi]